MIIPVSRLYILAVLGTAQATNRNKIKDIQDNFWIFIIPSINQKTPPQ
jgi:hypothetical protein